jgi:hypothetical protein
MMNGPFRLSIATTRTERRDERMKRMMLALMTVLNIFLTSAVCEAQAQKRTSPDYPNVEVGPLYSLYVTEYTSLSGGGGRITYNGHKNLAAEAELLGFGRGGVALFGLKATHRIKSVGIFAKFRPGITLREPTIAFDVGGGIEFNLHKHAGLRFDFGDLMTSLGSDREHALLFSTGVSFRF